MSVSINTNAGATFASVAAKRAAQMMDEAMIRLSTGKRINSAKDDSAGIQVAVRMAAEINGLESALRNAQDAQATIDTAEGAMKEIHTLLLRMREIAVSASSDTNSTSDRLALDTEISALETEITRIGGATTWGGINLLNGSFSKASPIVFQLGPRDGDSIQVTLGYVVASVAVTAQGTLGLDSNVTTRTLASGYIAKIDGAISIVSARRGSFGAVSNRLDSSISNLENMKANLITAKGGVEDADFAAESAKLARAQILMQAATAMLAQANASKNSTLQLITGR
jgi:flagellin